MPDSSNLYFRKSLLGTRADLQRVLHEETAYAFIKTPRLHFEAGDKADKILANRLKKIENRPENLRLHCDEV